MLGDGRSMRQGSARETVHRGSGHMGGSATSMSLMRYRYSRTSNCALHPQGDRSPMTSMSEVNYSMTDKLSFPKRAYTSQPSHRKLKIPTLVPVPKHVHLTQPLPQPNPKPKPKKGGPSLKASNAKSFPGPTRFLPPPHASQLLSFFFWTHAAAREACRTSNSASALPALRHFRPVGFASLPLWGERAEGRGAGWFGGT